MESGGEAVNQRIVTALVILPIVIFSTYVGGNIFALMVTILGVLAVFEGRTLLLAQGIHFTRLTYLLPLIYFGVLIFDQADMALQVVVASVLAILTRQLLDFPRFNLVAAGANLLVVFYPTLLLGNLLLLRLSAGWEWTFIPLAAVWAYDAFAYLFGVRFGKIRMWTSVSPKKSLEGAMAGLVSSVLIMVLARQFLDIGLMVSLFLGVILAGTAHVGDLVESALKRSVGVKDSGDFFPGHGGVLDRLDSTVYAASVVYWLWSANVMVW